jgi:photosystem II stability/assembly factor-like uncharacterized protein
MGHPRYLTCVWLTILSMPAILYVAQAKAQTSSQGATASQPSSPGLPGQFEPVGLGGGGAMYAPACSPHDPNLMFVSCDMGGFYRSTDGGKTWTMLDYRMVHGSTTCRPAFHPKDPKIVYFDGKVSRDRGTTWQRLLRQDAGKIGEMAVDPDEGQVLLVGTDKGAWISHDGGQSWQHCAGVKGSVVGIYMDPASQDPTPSKPQAEQAGPALIVVGTALGIFRSVDGGQTFTQGREGLPWLQIRALRGGRIGDGKAVLYCTVPSKSVKGRFDGGIYKSVDGGATWQSAMGVGLNTQMRAGGKGDSRLAQYSQLGVGQRQAQTLYVVCNGTGPQPPDSDTIYRSDDSGMTWRAVYYPDPRDMQCNVEHGWLRLTFGWAWGGLASPNGFTVNPARPDSAMVANAGELFLTADGGKTWHDAYTRYAKGQGKPQFQKRVGRWESVGLEVTTTWNYDIDPFAPERHYICYTDIGFAVSDDGGRTWENNSRSSGTPWTNTTYMLAFDPKQEGKAWAAMSNVHDIPHWTHIHDRIKGPGGVCVSTDHCQTWREASEGLPEAPCTSIVLDPSSAADSRTLYVTMYGQGVYKSADGGKTWERKSKGLPADNNHVFLVKRHPDGTLLVCVTGLRQELRFPALGGLYRSRDGAESWQSITQTQALHWPTGFDFDPKDSNVIYLAAATIPSGREGGVYKTTDGGATWKRLLRDEDFARQGGGDYVQAMYVTVDPRQSNVAYLGTESHGLWRSMDAGRVWRPVAGIPFGAIQRVAFDAQDRDMIYVTTFGGGVWRGKMPARGDSGAEDTQAGS